MAFRQSVIASSSSPQALQLSSHQNLTSNSFSSVFSSSDFTHKARSPISVRLFFFLKLPVHDLLFMRSVADLLAPFQHFITAGEIGLCIGYGLASERRWGVPWFHFLFLAWRAGLKASRIRIITEGIEWATLRSG